MGPSMCTIWLEIKSLGALGVLIGSYCFLPMRLQTPSAPCILSLVPPLTIMCSVQWLAESIHFCICQALVESLRRQLYQAPVCKHLLASTIVSGFGNCMWNGSPGGTVFGWPFFFFPFVFHTFVCVVSHGYFLSPSKRDKSIHTLVLLLLETHVVCELYLGYSELPG